MRTILQGLGITALLLGSTLAHAAKPKLCQSFKLFESDDRSVMAVCYDTGKARVVAGDYAIVTFKGVRCLLEEGSR